MRVHLLWTIFLIATTASAQSEGGRVTGRVRTLPIAEGVVTTLHLQAGFTTSVRLPEEISSVVLGDPATFKAEHSEAEPRLVFFKPITALARETNAFIATKSGRGISLRLFTSGKADGSEIVDFFVEYRRPQSLAISSDAGSFLVADTRSLSSPPATDAPRPNSGVTDPLARALEKQKSLSSPQWEGKEVLAAVGESLQRREQTMLGFSVLNRSPRVIELLSPQLELSGAAASKRGQRIKAEPVVVVEYRMTARRLAPGQRADGVVAFQRPAFKESSETLQLRLADAEQVNRPIVLPVPFVAASPEGKQ